MGWVVNATPRPFYPRKRLGTHCIGGLDGPQSQSGQVRKISSPPEFDPRTVEPVASRYTDCAIAAPPIDCIVLLNDERLGICRAVPAHAMEAYRERRDVTPFLTSAIDGLCCQLHGPAALCLGKNPGIHCIKGWLVPRASVDDVGGEIIHGPCRDLKIGPSSP
jgi:hypothetical protein